VDKQVSVILEFEAVLAETSTRVVEGKIGLSHRFRVFRNHLNDCYAAWTQSWWSESESFQWVVQWP